MVIGTKALGEKSQYRGWKRQGGLRGGGKRPELSFASGKKMTKSRAKIKKKHAIKKIRKNMHKKFRGSPLTQNLAIIAKRKL